MWLFIWIKKHLWFIYKCDIMFLVLILKLNSKLFQEQLKGPDSKPSMLTIIQNIHVSETFIKLYEMIEICILTCIWTFTAVLAQA